jgi:hypothetical protein
LGIGRGRRRGRALAKARLIHEEMVNAFDCLDIGLYARQSCRRCYQG